MTVLISFDDQSRNSTNTGTGRPEWEITSASSNSSLAGPNTVCLPWVGKIEILTTTVLSKTRWPTAKQETDDPHDREARIQKNTEDGLKQDCIACDYQPCVFRDFAYSGYHSHLCCTTVNGDEGNRVNKKYIGGGEIFRTFPDRPCGPPSLLYNRYRVFPGGRKRSGRDADPTPPSSAEV
jgi:hypothetical protein